jgi:hypothetical protein
MSFYRYHQTLGELHSAILARERRRALQRETVMEAALMLASALIGLGFAARFFQAGSPLPALNQVLAALRGWL